MPRRRRDESASEPERERSGRGADLPLERFTPRAQRVLAVAADEARRLQHPSIGPEHLMLAMVGDESATGTVALAGLGAQPTALAAEIERQFPPGAEPVTAPPTLAEPTERMLARVLRSMAGSGALVGTTEILSGILRDGALGDVLAALGVKPVRMGEGRFRRRVLRYEDVADGPRENVITLRVAEEDASAVDAMVEVGIMRTRSEAAAWLLHAGIGANQALFEKVRGLMDEIRGLREEAQRLAHEHTNQPQPGPAGA